MFAGLQFYLASQQQRETEEHGEGQEESLEGYSKLCVWQGAPFDGNVLMRLLKDFFKFRVRLAEQVSTVADARGSGGRRDVFFYIHDRDVPRFSVKRLTLMKDESGTLYVRREKPVGMTQDQVQRFYSSKKGLFDVRIACVDGNELILAFALFTLDQEYHDRHEKAKNVISAFIAADEEFQRNNPGVGGAMTVESGPIRWVEDVLTNDGGSAYSSAVLCRLRSAVKAF